MMYDEDFGYVTGGRNSVACWVAREGYERKMRQREDILSMVRENPFFYIWRDDKVTVMEAVIMDGMLLEYASDRVKDKYRVC